MKRLKIGKFGNSPGVSPPKEVIIDTPAFQKKIGQADNIISRYCKTLRVLAK